MDNQQRITNAMHHYGIKIESTDRVTLELSGFDLKLILTALREEEIIRLRATGWRNLTPNSYPPRYGYDDNAKPVRQITSVVDYIKKQIKMVSNE